MAELFARHGQQQIYAVYDVVDVGPVTPELGAVNDEPALIQRRVDHHVGRAHVRAGVGNTLEIPVGRRYPR
ncbi:hypothetical protein SDC9_140542 [bioreactor metagenome]|uniref:Uncharacterized protein n=1 Tax=bioreactor metagenome TaxID=1076179 RepID=A0A645DVT1_9ZZZZ